MRGLIGFIAIIFIIALTAGCIFHYSSDKQLNEMLDNSIAISEQPDSLSVAIETP